MSNYTNRMTILAARFAAVALALGAFAGCSKEVSKQEHLGDDRIPEARQIDALADKEESYGPFSFSPADDAKVIELVKRTGEFEAKTAAARAKLNAAFESGKTEMNGAFVVAESVRDKVPYKPLYEEVIEALGEVVLNPNYLGNSLYTGSVRMQSLLSAFNDAVLVALQANPQFLEEKDNFLQRYWAAISYGCRKDEPVKLKECVSLKFFTTDNKTSKILQFLAWGVADEIQEATKLKKGVESNPEASKKDIEEANLLLGLKVRKYNSLVTIALLSENRHTTTSEANTGTAVREKSPDMADALLLNGAVQYVTYLNSLPKKVDASRYISHHVDNIRSTILRAPDKLSDPRYAAAMRKILDNNDFWNQFSRRKVSEFAKWGPDLFSLAVDPRLCRDPKRLEAMKRSMEETDALGETGVLEYVRQIQGSAEAKMVKNLDANLNFAADDYVYVADQLFRGHWTVEDASSFWSQCVVGGVADAGAKLQMKRELITTLEKYMKLQIIRMLTKTSKFMGAIFSDKEASSKTMFRDAVENSEPLGNEWKTMLTQLRDFETLAKRFAKETNSSIELSEYKRIETNFANLKKNISMLAVYPNMLVLSFLMAKERFEMPLRTYFGEVNLSAEIVINWLFAQITDRPPQPWFNFGNDAKSIAKYENLYSFFFALKTNVFETIGAALAENGKVMDLTPKEYFKVIIDKFTSAERQHMRNYINALENTYRLNAEYNDTLAMCRAEEKYAADVAAGLNPRFPVYPKVRITYDKVTSYTFVGKDGYSDNFTAYPVQSFYAKENHLDQLRMIRNWVASSTVFLNSMIEIFEKHENQKIADVTDRAKKAEMRKQLASDLQEIRSAFTEVNDLKRRIYSTVLRVYNETRTCLDTMYAVERRQQYAIYDRAIAHLVLVHGRLKALREFGKTRPTEGAPAAEVKAWEAELQKLEDQYTSEIRVGADLGMTGDKPILVPLYDRISFAGGYSLSNWDLTLRAANWLQSLNPNISVERPELAIVPQLDFFKNGSSAESKVTIPYQEDPQAFASQALKMLNNRFLKLSSYGWSFDPFKIRAGLMVELYRAQEMKIFKDAYTTCTEQPEGPPICKTAMPPKEVTAKDLVNEVFHIARLMNIDGSKKIGAFGDTEADYMARLGLQRKFDHKEMRAFFMEERSLNTIPMFDLLLKRLMGYNFYLEEAKTAVDTLEAMRNVGKAPANDGSASAEPETGELVFLSDKDEVRKSAISQFVPLIKGSFDSIQKIVDEVNARAESDRGAPQTYMFEIDLSDGSPRPSIVLTPEFDHDNKPKYIDPARLVDFASMKRTFHTETKQRFRKSVEGTESEELKEAGAR